MKRANRSSLTGARWLLAARETGAGRAMLGRSMLARVGAAGAGGGSEALLCMLPLGKDAAVRTRCGERGGGLRGGGLGRGERGGGLRGGGLRGLGLRGGVDAVAGSGLGLGGLGLGNRVGELAYGGALVYGAGR